MITFRQALCKWISLRGRYMLLSNNSCSTLLTNKMHQLYLVNIKIGQPTCYISQVHGCELYKITCTCNRQRISNEFPFHIRFMKQVRHNLCTELWLTSFINAVRTDANVTTISRFSQTGATTNSYLTLLHDFLLDNLYLQMYLNDKFRYMNKKVTCTNA